MDNNLQILTKLISFIFLFLLGLFGFCIYENYSEPPPYKLGAFCGTISPSVPQAFKRLENDTVNLQKGKILFRSLCKSCHNENMKSDMTGPALGLTTLTNWAHKPSRFKEYINDPLNYVDVENPRRMEAVKQWDATFCYPGKEFSEDEAASIVLYITGKFSVVY